MQRLIKEIDYTCLVPLIDKINYFKNTKTVEGASAYNYNNYSWQDSGIETDKNKYKSMSILITNWNRQFYMPYVFNQYYFQNYPPELLEFIIVDDDSEDKQEVLNIVKEQVKLYPMFKIRFFQHHKNFVHTTSFRYNVGIRNAKNDILIFNETDNIPISDNYLQGVCYSHNLGEQVRCSPLTLYFSNILHREYENNDEKESVKEVFLYYEPHIRLDDCGCLTLNRNLFDDGILLAEAQVGWGGGEQYTNNKLFDKGGLVHLNTKVVIGILQNFPFKIKKSIEDIALYYLGNQSALNRPSNLWGTSEFLEEIDLGR